MIQPKIVKTNELRKYMGCQGSIIPRGSTVHLIAKIFWGNWRVGVVEFEGRRYVVPIRALWRLQKEVDSDA